MLIKTIEEIKGVLPVNITFDMRGISPFITRVENEIIIKHIGKPQYDTLQAAYDGNTLTSQQTALLNLLRVPLTNFSYLYWIPTGQVMIDNNGIGIESSADRKTAFQWQIDDLKSSFMNSGWSGIETMLCFMEENKADYPLWTASGAYTIFKESFINSAADFTKFYNIEGSRLVFVALKSAMKKVEDFFIKSSIGDVTFATLKTQINSNTLTSDNQALIEFIQPAVAHLTIAKALSDKAININENGVIQFVNVNRNSIGFKDGAESFIGVIEERCTADGQNYLKQLRTYLNTNASSSKYVDYFNSTLYIDLTTSSEVFKNPPHAGIILM